MQETSPRLCLVEDDPVMGESLRERLELEGYTVTWIERGRAALDLLRSREFDALICDVRLPDMHGDELFRTLEACPGHAPPPTLFITGYGTIEHAVELLKLGAMDYVTKPLDLDAFMAKVRAICNRRLPAAGGAERLGISPAMRRLAAQLPSLARHRETPVLIQGESGVGKEVVARSIHLAGGGRGPFLAINCAAIPEGLIELELFGAEKGAYTGAQQARAGVFERADGGMLLLDEIGDMPLELQGRLLRVIQEREVTRIGGARNIRVDVHLVCATHRDLRELVRRGRFREDLYYRINVLPLLVPPLRERPEDVLWLAEHFIGEHARQYPDEAKTLSPQARERLLAYPWPGNVRELKHVIERACILTPGRIIEADDLMMEAAAEPSDHGLVLQDYLARQERTKLLEALVSHDWNIQKTAAALGISRKSLWQKMKRYAIGKPV